MVDIASQLVKTTDSLNRQFVGTTETIKTSRIAIEDIDVLKQTEVVTSLIISSSTFIVDDRTQGELDGGYYLAGSGALDGYDSSTDVRVLNLDNEFIDRFYHSDFIDSTTSDGTWSSTAYTYTLTAAETLQSEIVARNNVSYTRGTLTVSGTDTSTATLSLSFNGGTSWQTVTSGTEAIASSSTTDGIKYKAVVASGSTVLTDVKLQYS